MSGSSALLFGVCSSVSEPFGICSKNVLPRMYPKIGIFTQSCTCTHAPGISLHLTATSQNLNLRHRPNYCPASHSPNRTIARNMVSRHQVLHLDFNSCITLGYIRCTMLRALAVTDSEWRCTVLLGLLHPCLCRQVALSDCERSFQNPRALLCDL